MGLHNDHEVLDMISDQMGDSLGRPRRSSITSRCLTGLGWWMAGLAAQWDTRLAAIKRMAENG